jgi:hypothetical protein
VPQPDVPTMKLSIALPTYNGEKYLRPQLESISAQTRLPDELIITDDASVDGTLAIAEAFRSSAPFPVLIFRNRTRLGCNGNFAEAISRCSGDVIALSDQDDVWKSRHVERLMQPFLQDEAVSLVVANSDYVDENLNPTGTTLWSAVRFTAADALRVHRGPTLRQWLKHHIVAGHALAFRAKLTVLILPFERSTYDQWLGIVCAACGKVIMDEEIVTLHRQHATQTMGHREMTLADRVREQPVVSTGHFEGQIDELRQLVSRLDARPELVAVPQHKTVIDERISLWEQRRLMRQGGAARRVIMATRLLLNGHYHRIGRGFLTYLRDLRG